MIRLTGQDWALNLRPEIGAAVARLTWRGRDILRPARHDTTGPLQSGCFPLVPFANRIAQGRFDFQGRRIALPATPGFEPHALHGVGWLRPWSVRSRGDAFAELTLAEEAGPDWPWRWAASHRFELSDTLEISLEITNQDPTPMPAGLGLHPYFSTGPESLLTVRAGRVWINDTAAIPNRLAPAADVLDWSRSATVASAPFVDNAYADWTGQAQFEHLDHVVTMTATSGARWAQIYVPGDADFACVEPVTHRPNAHNAPLDEDDGLVILEPGQTLSMSTRISVADRTPCGEKQ